MIIYEENKNIFDSDCNVLINPVNCVGVMGAGLALQFKFRYPKNYEAYRLHCFTGKMNLGKNFIFLESDKKIINFPTKGHWKNKSKLEYIERGLEDLITHLNKDDHIAMPLIGCGHGGLDTVDVIEIIHKYLDNKEFTVHLFLTTKDFSKLLIYS